VPNIYAKLHVHFSHRMIFFVFFSLFKELFSIFNSNCVIDNWKKCYLYISVQEELKNIYIICGIMLWVKGRGDSSFCWFWWIVDHQCLNFLFIFIYIYVEYLNNMLWRSTMVSMFCRDNTWHICYTVKVLLFVGTNFRCFYKMHWPLGSWIRGFNNQWENCISLDFYFRGLSGPRNQRKLESND